MYEKVTLFLGRTLAFRLSDLKREEGQGVTEYGIAVAFVVLALGAVLYTLAPQIQTFINNIGDDLANLPATF